MIKLFNLIGYELDYKPLLPAPPLRDVVPQAANLYYYYVVSGFLFGLLTLLILVLVLRRY